MFTNQINGSSVMINCKALRSIGSFDPIVGNIDQDGDLWLRYQILGMKASVIHEIGVFSRIHNKQLSNNKVPMQLYAEAVRLRALSGWIESQAFIPTLQEFAPYLGMFVATGIHVVSTPITAYKICRIIIENPKYFNTYTRCVASLAALQITGRLRLKPVNTQKITQIVRYISQSPEYNNFKVLASKTHASL
jgi:hypothetical protein